MASAWYDETGRGGQDVPAFSGARVDVVRARVARRRVCEVVGADNVEVHGRTRWEVDGPIVAGGSLRVTCKVTRRVEGEEHCVRAEG